MLTTGIVNYCRSFLSARGTTAPPTTSGQLSFLGVTYQSTEDPEFQRDLRRLIWVTFRKGFTPIPTSSLTTDAGFGCMIRTGQSLIAECFVRAYLGRSWRIDFSSSSNIHSFSESPLEARMAQTLDDRYRWILRLFADRTPESDATHPGAHIPFCVQTVATQATLYGKAVGQWFGPSTVASVWRDLLHAWAPGPVPFAVYTCTQPTLFLDIIDELCHSPSRPGRYWVPPLPTLPEITPAHPSPSPTSAAAPSPDIYTASPPPPTRGASTALVDPPVPESLEPYMTSCTTSDAPAPSASPVLPSTSPSAATPPAPCARGPWRPLVLLFPVRLGLEQLQPTYFEALRRVLSWPQSVGISGGHPCSSHYFFATQEDRIFYLDPHFVQPALLPPCDHTLHVPATAATPTPGTSPIPSTPAAPPSPPSLDVSDAPAHTPSTTATPSPVPSAGTPPSQASATPTSGGGAALHPSSAPLAPWCFFPHCTETFHYPPGQAPRHMAFADMDPSMCIGFYCETKASLLDLCRRLEAALPPGSSPIITVQAHCPEYIRGDLLQALLGPPRLHPALQLTPQAAHDHPCAAAANHHRRHRRTVHSCPPPRPFPKEWLTGEERAFLQQQQQQQQQQLEAQQRGPEHHVAGHDEVAALSPSAVGAAPPGPTALPARLMPSRLRRHGSERVHERDVRQERRAFCSLADRCHEGTK
ncbi:Cysteine protease ATG4C [Paratrimastix pyriformis]|uniref:Cysteine protease n=1 Tax=Paratrimastix pyriformis TaxID=342808 RepID=A0ABQ8US55_9EUKA|nr:Cysteine protease ATG4C [Paratrimastix pyriformis]